MKLIILKIIIFLIVEGIWSAPKKYSDKFKLFCGLPPYIKQRVIGGHDTVPGEFPFIVRILIVDKPPIFLCDGSLITDRHVLTATHCFTHHLNSTFIVRLGDYNAAPNKESEHAVVYNALTIISASSFLIIPYIADLAIIKLAERVKFNRRIAPICLPYKFSTDSLLGQDVTLIGFGLVRQRPDRPATILQKVKITVSPFNNCSDFTQPPGKICAGNPGKGPCFGDSGGPIFKMLKREEGHRYTQVGIVSNGPDLNCGKRASFTDVNFYLKWIESVLNQ